MSNHNNPTYRNIRAMLMLLTPLLLVAGVLSITQPQSMLAKAAPRLPWSPLISPPSDLQIVALDSSLHVTWTPSTDPLTAWHMVSIWEGSGFGTLQQSKIVGRTGKAIQANGLMPGHTYTIKVQALDAQGNLSAPISAQAATDPQSPMPNAAFFENFNEPAGDLDYNYFDVRTSHGVGLQPESIGVEKMLTFNNENHFHTQLIGGKQRAELYIRPRVPFDFANRTGAFQFEVDTPAVLHSEGKWFEIHLVRNIPWSAEEFGAGIGEDFPDSIEFSMRQGDGANEMDVNIPQITVNIGGAITTFQGTARQLTPVNIRMPVVLQVSQTSAEMFINGVSVVRATGYTLPFTRGYWMLAHRGWYASRDTRTSPVIVQLIHWETIQYDGPQGSYNPVVKTYLQPGCQGVVHNEHEGILGCSNLNFTPNNRTNAFNLNIQEDTSLGASARILYNGYAAQTGSLDVNINGRQMTVPTKLSGYLYTLNTADFPPGWLQHGNNSVQITYTGAEDAMISQVEIEVVYGQQRVMENSTPMDPMPMLAVTAQNFRIDHVNGDPTVYTTTTNIYSQGADAPLNYNATVISSETPWLSISPASGTLRSPALGYGLLPLTIAVDFTNIPVDADGEVGVIKITGGNMPVYIGVLAVNDGAGPRPSFIPSFSGANTTFNKNAIPGYHRDGTQTPAPSNTAPPVGTQTPTPVPTTCPISFTDVPNDYWAYQYINYMACQGVVSGYSDNTFRPGLNTTRGQLAKFVTLSEGWPIDTSGGPHFSDVPLDNPFYAYIETVFNHNAINGYSDGAFRWGNNTTRGQLCKIITLAAGWPTNTHGGPHFSDVPANDPFYGFIETAFNHNVITGYTDGTFRPGNNSTRAQVSKIIYNRLLP